MSTALLTLELRRISNNKRSVAFTSLLPAVFFLAFANGGSGELLDDITIAPYIMVSMATFGAMNALFVGSGLIAAERSIGWTRQLRVAGVPPAGYVSTKVLMAYITATVGVVVVFLLGGLVKDISMAPQHWAAAGLAILVGLLPVAALGVAVGYAARPQNLGPVFGIGSALLALLGGMWAPAETFPAWLQHVMHALPTYWSAAAGRAAVRGDWVGGHGAAVLAAWTIGLGIVAARAYRRDSLRPAAAGTT